MRTRSALAVAVTAVAAVAAAGRIKPALAVAVTAIWAVMVSGAAAVLEVEPASPSADAPSGEKPSIYFTINIRPEDAPPLYCSDPSRTTPSACEKPSPRQLARLSCEPK